MAKRTRLSVALLALSVSVFVIGCKGTGPHLEFASPGTETYAALEPLAITSLSPAEAVVVGRLLRHDGRSEGLILVTHSHGKAWKRVGFEVHDLIGVTFHTAHFADRLRGWVSGIQTSQDGATSAFVFRTEDGGNHWIREPLVMEGSVKKTLVHSLILTDESTGMLRVRYLKDSAELEDTFLTSDGGRTWNVTDDGYRLPPSTPIRDARMSFNTPENKDGWRLSATSIPGVTMVEQTASGGKSWMPIQELSAASLPTYYGSAASPRP